ncbi:DNA mismatch repair protein MutS [Alphaproteobacteria bacterium]|nr:DNA mismatch repair protein MutS [Alphaproteobacteria bacterium]
MNIPEKPHVPVNFDFRNQTLADKVEGATPMLSQYFEIKQQHPDSLLFFRMGDFYELFFDDAVEASRALDITLTRRGKHQDQDIPMCGVPFHAADVYLGRLIKQGFRVAICEQIEDPVEARKRGSKSVVKRAVARVITPGTITEESLLDGRSNNYLACVIVIRERLSIAWVDISTGDLQTQNLEPDQLGTVLARISPTEILVSEKLTGEEDGSEIISPQLNDWRSNLTILPHSRFDSANGIKRLEKLYNVATLDAFGSFTRSELSACGALVDYLEITQQGNLPRLNRPVQWRLDRTLEIDVATRTNLELLKKLSGQKKGSLLDCIDKTQTGSGARLLAARLSAPSKEVDIINGRLDAVNYFFESDQLRGQVREILRATPDLERALSRLAVDRGGPRDLRAVCDGLKASASLGKLIKNWETELSYLPLRVESNIEQLGCYTDLIELLNKALAENLPMFARDGGFIEVGHHAELDRLRALKDERRQLIAELQKKYADDSGINSIKIKHNNVLGYFVEVTSLHAPKLNSQESFIHRQTMTNATRFTTIELKELERDLSQAADRALAIEQKCFFELRHAVLDLIDQISRTAVGISEIDLSSSLAELAIEKNYVRPIINESLNFNILDGRHPVVEAEIGDGGAFVSNNCDLSSQQKLWLITGPNMAGKSTFLRQNALITILAHMGSYVPATFAEIGVVDRLFSRVGAADDLARGRSTFMVEMVETAVILNLATERSLVILDEIGRGTATFDGLSIAWAAIEHLHENSRCRTLFATHYHELTALASTLTSLSCNTMKIKEWKDDIIFLHEVSKGAADRSYGIHVAKLAGLPASVITRSKIVLENLEKGEKNKVIENLNEELPLFQSIENESHNLQAATDSKLESYLANINVDDLTPRQAIEVIYDLKKLAEN